MAASWLIRTEQSGLRCAFVSRLMQHAQDATMQCPGQYDVLMLRIQWDTYPAIRRAVPKGLEGTLLACCTRVLTSDRQASLAGIGT
jgi:hypothetical protein